MTDLREQEAEFRQRVRSNGRPDDVRTLPRAEAALDMNALRRDTPADLN